MRRRRGVALFAALSLTIVVGLLLTGAVATTRLMQRSGRAEQADAELSMDAEHALGAVLSSLHTRNLDDSPLGTPVTLSVPTATGAGVASVSVTRLAGG